MSAPGPLGNTLLVHWGRTGGGPRVLEEMLDALVARRPGEVYVSYNRDAENAKSLAAASVPSLTVTTYRSALGLLLKLPKMVVNSWRVRAFVRRHNVRTVVTTMEAFYQSMLMPLLLPRHVRYVFAIHDGNFHPGEGNLLVRMTRSVELRRADEIITFSSAVADEVRRRVDLRGRRVTASILPASDTRGIESSARTLPSDRPLVLGFFGRLTAYKGLDILLESARLLEETRQDIVVRIVGNGDLGRRLASEPSPSNVVWDVRWIPEEDVVPSVAAFDILALPYTEASQSGVLAQALSLGVPAVATPVGGLAEQVTTSGGGVVADAVDAESFTRAVVALVEDPDRYATISAAAVGASASDYSWDRFIDDLESVAAPQSEGSQEDTQPGA